MEPGSNGRAEKRSALEFREPRCRLTLLAKSFADDEVRREECLEFSIVELSEVILVLRLKP